MIQIVPAFVGFLVCRRIVDLGKEIIMKEKIMNPKIWLTIVAVMHILMGVIVNYQHNGSIENFAMFIYFAIVSVYLFYAAFMTEGQT